MIPGIKINVINFETMEIQFGIGKESMIWSAFSSRSRQTICPA